MRMVVREVGYEVQMIGQGEPLLLIHGFSGSSKQWYPFIEKWSKNYQMIMVDMLGHGSSDIPAEVERYRINEVIQDLAGILDQLKLTKVHMLGYSMGGRIALSFAVHHSERLLSLIIESSSPGLATETERLARRLSDNQLADSIMTKGIEWFAQYWGKLPLFATLAALPDEQQQALQQARLSNSTIGLAQSLRGIGTGQQPSWWEHLDRLSIPVLLIAGELDRKYCEIAKAMASQISIAELEIVAEAGHNVHMEQSQRFDTIVKNFLMKKGWCN